MTDPFARSVTQWLVALKHGEHQAVEQLWNRYFEQLVVLAERKLGRANRRVADEEDLALSVFHALSAGAAAGRFDRLESRTDLWSLLVAITSKKAVDRVRRQTAQKRGGGEVLGNSAVMPTNDDAEAGGFEQIVGNEPTPEMVATLEEEYQRLLELLRDDVQRQIVGYRLAGHNVAEIASLLGISIRSVERKLQVVREIWAMELPS